MHAMDNRKYADIGLWRENTCSQEKIDNKIKKNVEQKTAQLIGAFNRSVIV